MNWLNKSQGEYRGARLAGHRCYADVPGNSFFFSNIQKVGDVEADLRLSRAGVYPARFGVANKILLKHAHRVATDTPVTESKGTAWHYSRWA